MAELKFDPGFGVGEYLRQNNSIMRVNLTQILVQAVTQFFTSK